MQKIVKWLCDNKLILLVSSLIAIIELTFFVFPIGWGYYYKKLLVMVISLTWFGMVVRIPSKMKLWLSIILVVLMPAVMITWLEKMTEHITNVEGNAALYNIVIAYVIEIIVLLFTLSVRVTVISTSSFLTLLYTINYFAYIFRGKALSINDIWTLRTTISIIGNYDLTPSNIMVVAWSFCLLFITLATKIGPTLSPVIKQRKRWILRLSGLLTALFISFGAIRVFGDINYWESRNVRITNGFSGLFHSDGLLVSTCIELIYGGVKTPENYSPSSAQALLAEYTQENITDDPPHIIMIMNESFADLRVWGNLEVTQEFLPFFYNLTENTIHGYVNASILGGGTANSEFEVLTGNTMLFLPSGYFPYQQCITDQTTSLVSVLEKEGYTSYAIHPESRTNWNREKVYQNLGFDYSLWLEDFEGDEILNNGISDKCVYEKIIELYESRDSGQKLFFHNVTMQNHGGYTWTEIEHTVSATNLDYPVLDTYLSLLTKSDEAFEMLINYFSSQNEKVIICMYGDHQPKFENSLSYDLICAQTDGLTELDKQANLYKTPFIIWANYDIDEMQDLDISMNYLGALTLQQTGINSYPYFNYLNELRQSWPILSINCIYDGQKQYSHLNETGTSLNEYCNLQYYQIFEH